ncbi:hypothetical protein BU17DRAFT_95406 [Hysterangium stoloniferum]|nr:hypothetical protein BU17DRAFT_95406 [Hysterangium stoloniferum]
MHPSTYFALLFTALLVSSSNITIDNSSPQVIYSPTPCFIQNIAGCNTDWFRNGSDTSVPVTSTNGPDTSNSTDSSPIFIPRVSFTFNGSEITFVPGPESGALATVTVDDLPSVLIDTSITAFKGTSLGGGNHTVVVTWAGSGSGSLDVLSFVVEIEDVATSLSPPQSSIDSLSSTSLFSSPLPTHSHHSGPDQSPAVTHSLSTGTIAAIVVAAAAFILLAGLTWFFTAQRRRRRRAIVRERAILGEMRMPSEGEGIGIKKGSGRDLEPGGDKAKKNWKQRDSLRYPVHYTPWRGR